MNTQTILHLATGHQLFDTRIVNKMAKTHQLMGYKVVVIMPDSEGPRSFTNDGIEFLTVSGFTNGIDRYLNSTRAIWEKVNEFSKENIAIQFHDYDLLPHMILASLQGWKVIYDAHEDMPRLIKIQHWVPCWFKPIFSLLLSLLEWLGGKLFIHIITATEVIAQRFPDEKTTVIKNYPLIESWSDTPYPAKIGQSLHGRKDLLYVGGISENKGVWDMIYVVGLLNEKRSTNEEPHILHLCGPCYPNSLKEEIISHKYARYVKLYGWVNQAEVKKLSRRCMAGFVLLHYLPQYEDALPTKLYEYMLYGLPTVCSKTKPMIETVNKYQCGYLFDPEDHDKIVSAILDLKQKPILFNQLSTNAINAVKKQLNWTKEARKLKRIYKELE